MISIIITSYKEPKTIGKAVEHFLQQKIKDCEIIVSAPDEQTLDVVRKIKKQKKNKEIKIIKDPGKGKPAALNLCFKKAKGDFLVLTDGDVFVSKNSAKYLIGGLKDKDIGAVSGRVISINNKDNMFGYWAFILTESFHIFRLRQSKEKDNILCSGYLYAIKKNLINKIPEKVLADDAFISHAIIQQDYRTVYEPLAKVYVKYPENLIDWIKQKKRTAGRYYQLSKKFKIKKTTSFIDEIISAFRSLKFIRSVKHVFWFFLLIVMKLYIWFRVFFDFRLWKRNFERVWQRVESTK